MFRKLFSWKRVHLQVVGDLPIIRHCQMIRPFGLWIQFCHFDLPIIRHCQMIRPFGLWIQFCHFIALKLTFRRDNLASLLKYKILTAIASKMSGPPPLPPHSPILLFVDLLLVDWVQGPNYQVKSARNQSARSHYICASRIRRKISWIRIWHVLQNMLKNWKWLILRTCISCLGSPKAIVRIYESFFFFMWCFKNCSC